MQTIYLAKVAGRAANTDVVDRAMVYFLDQADL